MSINKQKQLKKKIPKENSVEKIKGKISTRHDYRVILWAGIIAVLTFIVYLSALKNGLTNWDDQKYVIENMLIRDLSFHGIKALFTTQVAGNLHPLTMLSLALNYKISGLDPFSYHLFNVILHVLNSLLVFFFIYKLTKQKLEIAVITALFFAVHPMHVESVAWVSARKDVLFGFFFLAGLIAYLRYLDSYKIKWLLLTGILFVFSLMSKPAAAVFPLILFLIDYLLKRKTGTKSILEKVPFFIISLVAGFLTLSTQSKVGAMSDTVVYTLFQKVLFASQSILVYAVKAIVPYKLCNFYPYPFRKEIPLFYYISPFIILGIIAAFILLLRRNRVVVFGSLFFIINLAMVLQFISFGNAIMAERYTYIPYIGLFFMVGSGVSYLVRGKGKNILIGKFISVGLLCLLVLLFSVMVFERNKVWKSSEILWTDVIQKYPDRSIGWYNRGDYYTEKKENEKAIHDFSMVITLSSRYYEAYYNRAQLYRLSGMNEKSLADYDSAMSIRPKEIKPYITKGLAYFNLNQYDNALELYRKATSLQPDNYELWLGIANAYYYKQQFKPAIENYTKALELNNGSTDALYNRAVAYAHSGEINKALDDLNNVEKAGHAPDKKLRDWLNQQKK